MKDAGSWYMVFVLIMTYEYVFYKWYYMTLIYIYFLSWADACFVNLISMQTRWQLTFISPKYNFWFLVWHFQYAHVMWLYNLQIALQTIIFLLIILGNIDHHSCMHHMLQHSVKTEAHSWVCVFWCSGGCCSYFSMSRMSTFQKEYEGEQVELYNF